MINSTLTNFAYTNYLIVYFIRILVNNLAIDYIKSIKFIIMSTSTLQPDNTLRSKFNCLMTIKDVGKKLYEKRKLEEAKQHFSTVISEAEKLTLDLTNKREGIDKSTKDGDPEIEELTTLMANCFNNIAACCGQVLCIFVFCRLTTPHFLNKFIFKVFINDL